MATKYDLVALLPMKANSERVKGKNFREFAGKPLFRWILNTLLDVDEIDCIVINTDARSILAEHGLVETNRIMIRDRKADLCGDRVSMNMIIEDDINNVKADTYLMTHTTNPLLSSSTIRSALNAYSNGLESDKDSLFTVNKFQTRFYRENGDPVNHDPNNFSVPKILNLGMRKIQIFIYSLQIRSNPLPPGSVTPQFFLKPLRSNRKTSTTRLIGNGQRFWRSHR